MLAIHGEPAILNQRIIRIENEHLIAVDDPFGHDVVAAGRARLKRRAVGRGGAIRIHQGLVQIFLDRIDVLADGGVEVDIRAGILEIKLQRVLIQNLHADLRPVGHLALEVFLGVLDHDRIKDVGCGGVRQLRVDLHLDGILVGIRINRRAVGPLQALAQLDNPGQTAILAGRQLCCMLRNELQMGSILRYHLAHERAQMRQAGGRSGGRVHVRVLRLGGRRPAVQDVVCVIGNGAAGNQYERHHENKCEKLLHKNSLLLKIRIWHRLLPQPLCLKPICRFKPFCQPICLHIRISGSF